MRPPDQEQTAIVRQLGPADAASIRAHFVRLDPGARRARFCATLSDHAVQRYARAVMDCDTLLCGAFIAGHLRGVVELRGALRSWLSSAEAAFSVETGWQDKGIGDLLFERMIVMARNRRIKSIALICLRDNIRMSHLAEKHAARLSTDHDITEAILHPGPPTPASLATEVMAETKAYGALWMRGAATCAPLTQN